MSLFLSLVFPERSTGKNFRHIEVNAHGF
jgi:hypothetical protein